MRASQILTFNLRIYFDLSLSLSFFFFSIGSFFFFFANFIVFFCMELWLANYLGTGQIKSSKSSR